MTQQRSDRRERTWLAKATHRVTRTTGSRKQVLRTAEVGQISRDATIHCRQTLADKPRARGRAKRVSRGAHAGQGSGVKWTAGVGAGIGAGMGPRGWLVCRSILCSWWITGCSGSSNPPRLTPCRLRLSALPSAVQPSCFLTHPDVLARAKCCRHTQRPHFIKPVRKVLVYSTQAICMSC
jgi:hypothetical protein